jgi:O-antigen ligase
MAVDSGAPPQGARPAGADGEPLAVERPETALPLVSASPPGVKPLLCWALCAFVASLPFERIRVGIPVSPTRLVGYCFFLLALLSAGVCFRRFPKALGWFGLYAGTYALLGLAQPKEYWPEIADRVGTLVQVLVLFWVSFNLLRYPGVARRALLTLGISSALLAALQLSGVAASERAGRISALGQNPNEVAACFAVGAVALFGLAGSQNRSPSWVRLLFWLASAVLGLAVLQTESRGGLFALGVGMVLFVLGGGKPGVRLRNGVIVVLAVGLLTALSYCSEASRRRWEAALSNGDLAHREELYPNAWAMFLERPLIGWGPGTHLYELGSRCHFAKWGDRVTVARDTHNLFLYVLTGTGLLGSLPFLAGTWLCVREAWRKRRGPEGILPLALALTILTANLSGTFLYDKLHWFIMAYALASGSPDTQTGFPRRMTAGVCQ